MTIQSFFAIKQYCKQSREDMVNFLAEKKEIIVKRWSDQVLDSYGSPEFFKKQKNQFANPIGSTISAGLQDIYTVLAEGQELGRLYKPLENIVKIRAVQDFTPSQSTSFVYLLKTIVRQELAKDKKSSVSQDSLLELDTRIDQVALMAFDIYMECRERLHQIRINEVLSGRHALTDGTKCVSAMLKKN
jgi:hypothetical protein